MQPPAVRAEDQTTDPPIIGRPALRPKPINKVASSPFSLSFQETFLRDLICETVCSCMTSRCVLCVKISGRVKDSSASAWTTREVHAQNPQTIKRWNVHFPRLKPFFLSFIVPLSPLTGSRGERALLKTSWGSHDSCEHQQPRRPSLIRELPEDSTTSCQEGKWWLSAPCRVPLHTTSGKAPSETPVIVSCSSTGRRTGIRRRSHV